LLTLVSGVCGRPRLVLILSAVLVAASVWASSTHLEYHTSRNDLVSPDKDYQKRWRAYLDEFGDDDDMVVVVQGKDPDRMRAALEDVAAGVRERPELFDRLFYKVDLRHLHNRALLFLPEEQIRAIRDNLGGMGDLLEVDGGFSLLAWKAIGLRLLTAEATRRVANLQPGQPLSADDARFFGQYAAICKSADAYLADPGSYANPWGSLVERPADEKDLLAEPQFFFNGDGTLAFLMCRPVKEAGSFTAALKSVAALHEILAAVRQRHPHVEIGLTGMPVLETDEMAAAEHDTRLASWLAIGGVSVLFLLVYRGLAYPALTVVTLLTGTAWAMGWVTLTVGHLNILSATFAVMLIGMGDYGVLWVMRYEHARKELGLGVRESLLHTTDHVAIGNLTAASTLALAFFAAMFADFKAVAELGFIAGCGVLLCAFACFTVLPALLMVFDRRQLKCEVRGAKCEGQDGGPVILPFTSHLAPRTSHLQDGWLPGLWRRPGLVLALGLAVVALLGVCAVRVRYDHNLLHLQAQDLESVRWEKVLIEKTSGASWHALSTVDDSEQALALKARYEQLPEVSRVVEVATLVPPHQERKIELLADIRHRLRNLPDRNDPLTHLRPSAADVRGEVAALLAMLDALGEDSPLAERRTAVRALVDHLGQVDALTAAELLGRFDERLAQDLRNDLYRLHDVAEPQPVTVEELPPDLRERQIGKSGRFLLRVFARDCLWDFEPLEHFCDRVKTVDPQATGKPFGTVEGLKAMKGGLERAGLYAFGVIALVLLLDFRRLGHMLIALAPLVLAVVLAVGVLGLFNIPLSPANMIAFPLILGVGVDNGVHILHDYLIRRREGMVGGPAPVSRAIGRGVLVKALTTMIGFGALMISTERGLASLGFLLALGVGCSMLTALVLLPALLQLVNRRPARKERPALVVRQATAPLARRAA
jgi:hopanoid biosynthesis associated RND transporter like protein HpnN